VRASATLESRRFAWMLMSDGFAVVVAQALVRPTGPPLGPAGWQSHLRTSTTLEGEAMATGSSPEIIATSRLFLEVSLSTVVFPRPRAAAEVGPSPHVGQTVCADDPGYGLEQAQPITSGLLAALRVLHQSV